MNVLLFVFTMLMVISLMTYSRIEAFLGQSAIRQEYLCTITSKQRAPQNEMQSTQYDTYKGKKAKPITKDEESSDEKEEPVVEAPTSKKEDGTRFINIGPFLSEELRQKDLKKFEDLKLILSRLINSLYGDQPFFRKIYADRPYLTEDLLEKLIIQSSSERYKNQLPRKKDLATINFEDKNLQYVYAKMLRGTQTGNCETKGKTAEERLQILKRNYPSLFDYLTLNKKDFTPIRLSLAPPELLLAIFGDQDTVNHLIESRTRLTNEVIKAPKTVKESEKKKASEDFHRLYIDRIPPDFDPETFSFAITQTKP